VHWPALDGVRALAVAAVIVYHARPGWLPGGFLGVDVFFVLSGFLITSLLLRERRSTGHTALRSFWMRRARRLLPALYVLLAVLLAYEVVVRATGLSQMRWDALAALGYATNWFLIGHQQSYFAAFTAPDALQHLWSLAVEEQFYLVWPLAVATGLLRRRGALAGVLLAAAGSAVLCGLLYTPGGDPSRVYFGTDTHSAGLLAGAALALAHARWWPREQRVAARPTHRRVLQATVASTVALALLLGAALRLDETQSFVYRGGLAAVAVCTAVLLGVLLHPSGARLARAMGSRPLRWVGVRSYGIYLWHWPVLVLSSPHGDPRETNPGVMLAQVAASVLLAALSFRFVETPIRSGAVGRALRSRLAVHQEDRVTVRLALGGAAGAAAGCACALLMAVVASRSPEVPAYQRMLAVHIDTQVVSQAVATSTRLQKWGANQADPTPEPTAAPAPPPPTAPPAPDPSLRVTAVGDSVMLGAAAALAADVPNLDLDAKVGRQMSAALDILRTDRDTGRLGNVVVVHMGSNGYLTRGEFDEMMQILSGVRRVIVLNDKVPRPWEDSNDALLADAAAAYPTVRLLDWRAVSTPHPELFWDDATHLRPQGAQFYAELVAQHLHP
jgi:peptidoglycan/LPS O-acetylase OafA/YrhL